MSIHRMLIAVYIIVSSLALPVGSAYGQITSTLYGVVQDSQGAVVPGDVPAAVEFGRVAAAPVNTLRQQTHRCQEISVCF